MAITAMVSSGFPMVFPWVFLWFHRQEQRGLGGANAQLSDESQKLYERTAGWSRVLENHGKPWETVGKP